MTFSTYCAHTDPIFNNLNVFTIDKLVIHRIGIMMYKFNNGLLPTVLNSSYKKIMKFTHMTLEHKIIMFRISAGIQSFSSVSSGVSRFHFGGGGGGSKYSCKSGEAMRLL